MVAELTTRRYDCVVRDLPQSNGDGYTEPEIVDWKLFGRFMANFADQQTLTLPNGLKVVLVERPFGKGFSAILNLRAGSQQDPPKAVGVAHLAEHLAFTGQTRVLSRELSEQSVRVNATTAQQRTAFYVSGHHEFLNQGLQLLATILDRREIDSEDCLHERNIVYQELVDGEPDSLCERTAAYWVMNYRLSGDPNWHRDYQQRMASVTKLTSEAVNRFRKQYYRPEQAAIAIVAPCDLEVLRRMIEDHFGLLTADAGPVPSTTRIYDWQETPEFNFHFDWWPNMWVSMVNSAADADVVTRLAAGMLAHHFGGGEHSEMFSRFRDESSDAYNATTDYECWLGHTSVNSFVSVHKKSAVEALAYLIERGERFASEGIDEEQRDSLIERTRRWWEMRMESDYTLADYLSFEALRPEGSSMVDLRPDSEVLRETTKEQFSDATRRLFDPCHRRVFVGGRLGPLGRRRIRNLG